MSHSSSQQTTAHRDISTDTDQNGRKSGKLLPAGLVLSGKWEIIEHIASGGKGDVYRAHQKNLERDVALKTVSSSFADNFKDHAEELESEIERFRREVQVMASIRHPNVVQIFDYDTEQLDGSIMEYLVLEYIPGKTMRSTMLKQGFGLDKEAVVNWIHSYFLPVLEGLQAVHDAGIVHRDIKPENILMDGETPKLADFGLAKTAHNHGLTRTFDVLGTIFYMPKEQFEDGSTADARADVYALGKILFEAVTGKITNRKKVVFKTVRLPLSDPVSGEDVFFQRLDAIIQNATHEEPEGRTPSATFLHNCLSELIAPCIKEQKHSVHSGTSRTKKFFYATVVALLLCILGITSYHFLLSPKRNIGQTSSVKSQEPVLFSSQSAIHQLQENLTESDGAVLRLVKGGQVRWIPELGKQIQTDEVPSFYIEDDFVTNLRYVEFLNAIYNTLTIKDSVVFFQGAIFLLLGEVTEGYEPIVHQNGKFSIKEINIQNNPVVRVTPEGAQAYAHYNGREMLTPAQWLLAGIKRKDWGGVTGEWGYLKTKDGERFFSLPSKNDSGDEFCPLIRQRWESLPDVGFRTIRPVIGEGGA